MNIDQRPDRPLHPMAFLAAIILTASGACGLRGRTGAGKQSRRVHQTAAQYPAFVLRPAQCANHGLRGHPDVKTPDAGPSGVGRNAIRTRLLPGRHLRAVADRR